MKKKLAYLLCLALALLLSAGAIAEALSAEDEGIAAQGQAEAVVNEFELTLNELDGAEETVEALPNESLAEGEAQNTEGEAAGPEQTEEPGSAPAMDTPIAVQTIKVSKNISVTVHLGISYALDVKGGIKTVASDAKNVAAAAKDGALTLKKTGKAKLTVKTGKGKKFTVSLTVADVPAPGSPGVTSKSGKFKLSWDGAKYATGYVVKYSYDQKSWTTYKTLAANITALNVTELVTGTVYFRVTAILGDRYGGTAGVSALAPITDAKVICQEAFYKGPSDKLNVTWSACGGATSYEVYRATLPSEDYELLGTTTKTWYPDTRAAKTLCAYRIKPICEGVDLPMTDPVTLWSDMGSNVLPPSKLTSKTGIILVVNKKAQVVTAYIQDADGKYTLPLRHMICSTGRTYERTKNGTWKIEGRKGQWYTYPGPSGDTIRWPTKYRSGYYFHSPLYNRDHSIRGYTVKRLGERASAGCVRLKVTDAEWVYKNCGTGTPVYICDGKALKELKKALKPKDVKVNGF